MSGVITRWPSAALARCFAPLRSSPLIGRILCRIDQHDYAVIHKITDEIDHIGCRRCKKQWGINYGIERILEWEIAEVLTRNVYTPDPAEVARRLDPTNYTKKVEAT